MFKSPLQRVAVGGIVLASVLILATIGYHLLGRPWVEAAYMTVITVATIGYGERTTVPVQEQIFTMIVIVVGLGASGYTLGGLLQLMVDGEIDRLLGQQRMNYEISTLKNHVVICGYGRLGQMLAEELARQKKPFVIVELEPERVKLAKEAGYLVLHGDATEEEVLKAAGVQSSRTLVTCLPNDAANVFITLTGRGINESLHIISRAANRSTEKKLIQAGANRVVLPSYIGAMRMARMVTRPATADVVELVADFGSLSMELDEFSIPASSALVGMTVAHAGASRRHKLLFVAVKQSKGQIVFNPDATYAFTSGDTVVAMGKPEDIEAFRKDNGV